LAPAAAPALAFALQTLLAARPAGRPVLSDGSVTLDARELVDRVDRLGRRLSGLGSKSIAIALDNGIEWIVCDLAARSAGIVAVPLPRFFTPAQKAGALAGCSVDLLAGASADEAAGLGFGRSQGQLGGSGRGELFGRDAGVGPLVARDAGVDPKSCARRDRATCEGPSLPAGTAKVTFTSGTSGTPKGVCLSDSQQWRVASSLVAATADLGLTRHLCLLPLAVLLENVAGVYAPLLAGAEVVAPPLAAVGVHGSAGLDTAVLLAAIARHRPASVILLPQMLAAWVAALRRGARVTDTLRFVAVGGGRVDRSLIDEARARGIPAYEGYGLSECASVVSLNTPGADRPGTVGRPLAHLEVEIAADGELLVSGSGFLGYCGAGPDGRDFGAKHPSTRASWPTGDLGRLDADGYLVIDGRKKDVLITSFGRNVSPEWPESTLCAQAGIAQAAVFGEARPRCVALLVPSSSEVSDAALAAAVDRANAALPDYARIAAWARIGTPFAPADGLATANGRLRREAIERRFHAEIDACHARVPGP
jgi:long-subunit acyl-CoA synthetase (AMP-forming)